MWAMGDTYKCFDSWSTFGCTIWIVGLLYSLFLFPLLIDRIQCWSAHVWIHGIYGIYVCSIEGRIKRLFQSPHRLGFRYFFKRQRRLTSNSSAHDVRNAIKTLPQCCLYAVHHPRHVNFFTHTASVADKSSPGKKLEPYWQKYTHIWI